MTMIQIATVRFKAVKAENVRQLSNKDLLAIVELPLPSLTLFLQRSTC